MSHVCLLLYISGFPGATEKLRFFAFSGGPYKKIPRTEGNVGAMNKGGWETGPHCGIRMYGGFAGAEFLRGGMMKSENSRLPGKRRREFLQVRPLRAGLCFFGAGLAQPAGREPPFFPWTGLPAFAPLELPERPF